ncbi:MAG: gliding motility protein GldC [Flavobacteriales bacterium]|nr:gliding motility protein GldC [Flavobacteriales bacterium]MCX7649448.1 gliding motility protein GldC [Flavobacteriales bacterium]MDW8432558.1 gliding motility protein GldC [Flavobacteriales bacterium]
MTQESHIKIRVRLDENKIPEEIGWEAPEAGFPEARKAEAMMLSLWDPKERNTLRLDLWTKEMTVEDMKQFVHQAILLLSETLENATGEKEMAEHMRDFARWYAEEYGFA